MPKLLNRGALALRLEISPARVQQLTGEGVLPRRPGGYDLLECALAFAKWLRRDEAATTAKARRELAHAARSELRMRTMLRQLLTVAEVRELFLAIVGGFSVVKKEESSTLYHKLRVRLDEPDARAIAEDVYKSVNGLSRGWSNGFTEILRRIEQERLPDKARLDELLADLMAAAAGEARAVPAPERKQ